jgi:hypothetical protein
MDCPNCRAAAAAEALECGACGVIFAKWAEKAARAKAERLAAAQADVAAVMAPAAVEDGAVAPLSPRQAVALPAAVFAAAFVFSRVELLRFVVQSGFAMELHELGHAVVNWLGGRLAVPLPMFTVVPSEDRAWWFAAAVLAGLAALAWKAWTEDCPAVVALCGVLFALQVQLTLLARPAALSFWVAFGGLGGECVLSALLIVLYFERLPRAVRWPAYRAIFLFIGACVLASSVRRWRDADADFMNVPWGSFWGGDGDVEAMIGGGWTVNVLVKVYLRLAWACVGACALAWARAAWAVRGRWSRPAELLE